MDNVHRLKSDPLVWKFSSNTTVKGVDESRNYLRSVLDNYAENKHDFQALFLKNTLEYIGEAGILSYRKPNNRAIIGYNLLPQHWNNGYATEIVKALVKYLFEEEQAERIEALALETNAASRKVLEKVNFTLEGVLRNYAFIENKYFNVCYYGIIKEDYANT